MLQFTYKVIKRMMVLIIGFTVILLGTIMLVTPGPGMLAIIAGLSILATELLWARLLMKRLKDQSKTYSHGFMAWLQKHFKLDDQ